MSETHEITIILPVQKSACEGRQHWTEYLPICSECGPLHPARGYYYTKRGAENAGERHVRRHHPQPEQNKLPDFLRI